MGTLQSLRVLVVDDEIHLCRLMTRELAYLGVGHYDYATDYDTAVSKLEKYVFDVVISDILMPGKSGFDLLDTVSRRWPKVLMGFASAIECPSMDGAFFWQKPFDPGEVERFLLSVAKGLP